MLSTVAIGMQVTMVLTLVGVSRGMLAEMASRAKGVGADIIIRAPGSQLIGFSTNFSDKFIPFIRKQPHVTAVAGTLLQPVGGIDSITGLDLSEFNAVSGGFHFLEGGPFTTPDDVIVDEVYARSNNVQVGSTIDVANHKWTVRGVVESGKLSRMFVQLPVLQEMYANTGKVTSAYVKLDDPERTKEVIDQLKSKLEGFKIYSTSELVSLMSVDNVPLLKPFIWVIITIGVLIGFIVVFLSMYTAVLERTREIGILKALGASKGYIISVLMRETALLAIAGSVVGILLTFGTKWLITTLVPSMSQIIVPDWWPIATAIALVGALLGCAYPGLKAARQDAIEALAYD